MILSKDHKWIQYLAYGVGHMQNDLSAALWFSYFVFFYQKVLCFDPTVVGILMIVGQFADAVATPICGYESDKAPKIFPICGRYGRRKSWHLGGVIAVTISFPFLFWSVPEINDAAQWARCIFYAPVICLFQFGWASTQVAHMSLIPEMAEEERERVILNSLRYAAQVVANVLAYGIFWSLLGMEASKDEFSYKDLPKFRNLALICDFTGLFFAICFQLGIKEAPILVDRRSQPQSETQPQPHQPSFRKSEEVKDDEFTWRSYFKLPVFYLVGCLYVCARMIFNVGQTYLPFYLEESLKLGNQYVAILPLIVFVAGFVASLLTRFLSKILGLHAMFVVGAVAVIGASVWMYFPIKGATIYGPVIFLGAGQSVLVILSMSFITEMIGGRKGTAGFVFGFMSTVEKISGGVVLLALQHSTPEKNRVEERREFYKDIMAFLCGCSSLVAVFFLAGHWCLSCLRAKQDQADEEIEDEPELPDNFDRQRTSAVGLLGAEVGEIEDSTPSVEMVAGRLRRRRSRVDSIVSSTERRRGFSIRDVLEDSFKEGALSFKEARGASIMAFASSTEEELVRDRVTSGSSVIVDVNPSYV